MATYSRGFRVPEAGDANAVPADFVAFGDTIVPAMTTAALAALSWAQKPAGWVAFDTTKSKLVRSTGAAMIDVIDANGGTIPAGKTLAVGALSILDSGDGWVTLEVAGSNLRLKAGTADLRLALSTASTLQRETEAGDSAKALVTKGYADAIDAKTAWVVGGVLTGTTDASGNIALVVPAVPSGATGWAVSVHLVGATSPLFNEAHINSVVGALGSINVRGIAGVAAASTAVTIHWQAVAY